jgi:hypothetical protein
MKLMLDSGAFTAWTKGVHIDIDEYAEYVKRDKLFDYAFNLDVIGDGAASYHNWKYLRKLGVNTIPVFHIGTDEKYFVKYAKQTDYIGIGAIAKLSSVKRIYGLRSFFTKYVVDEKGYPKVKLHGLGITMMYAILGWPWYSIDSTAVLKSAAFGKIFVPKFKNGKPHYFEGSLTGVSDQSLHDHGSFNSAFGSHGTKTRAVFEDFVAQWGYKLGTIRAVDRQLSRGDKNRKVLNSFGLDLGTSIDPDVGDTLASNTKLRIQYNTRYWYEFRKRLHAYHWAYNGKPPAEYPLPTEDNETMTIYLVGSNESHTRLFLGMVPDEVPDVDLLISYLNMNSKMVSILSEYKLKGDNK